MNNEEGIVPAGISPLPWHVEEYGTQVNDANGHGAIAYSRGTTEMEDHANFAFIVTAVNSYEDLTLQNRAFRTALEEVRDKLDWEISVINEHVMRTAPVPTWVADSLVKLHNAIGAVLERRSAHQILKRFIGTCGASLRMLNRVSSGCLIIRAT